MLAKEHAKDIQASVETEDNRAIYFDILSNTISTLITLKLV